VLWRTFSAAGAEPLRHDAWRKYCPPPGARLGWSTPVGQVPYGTGTRMKIKFTRAMIRAALSGALDLVAYEKDATFNLDVPTTCPDVPATC